MNALMMIEAADKPALSLEIPRDQTFDEWTKMGRDLADGQRVINWWIGDWWIAGHKYGERAKAAAEGLFGLGFERLMDIGSVCRAFPETSSRNEAVPFTVHRHIAPVARDYPAEGQKLLKRAEQEGWTHNQARVEAMKRKVALGLFKPRDQTDDDPDYLAIKAMAAAWNRASVDARREFADMVAESGMGVIEA